jgi:xanthine dehydrogenase accessory factor
MRDLLADYDRLRASGPVGRGVVTRVWGSAPRLPGAVLLATADGRMAGSVSGGCVEGAVVEAIGEAIRTGNSRLLSFTVTHERAWEVGLACGGSVDVFVEPTVRDEVLAAARGTGGAVVPSVVGGGAPLGAVDPGLSHLIGEDRAEALATEMSKVVEVATRAGEVSVFLEVFPSPRTLLVIGGGHLSELLVTLARPLGYRTVVADPRAAFLTQERFPDADLLLPLWPAEAFTEVGLDPATAVCVLSHDPKFDEPALELALRSRAGYIGAIGSRKTQAERRAKLLAAGFTEAEVARIHGPIGLDLGGRQPAEIALAILAEIVQARYRPQ